jgi:uncharacterized glyoxalase superfamily protein PhnB
MKVSEIEATLSVASIEDTVSWYERVLGWKGHFDVSGEDGKCNYGSIFAGENCYFNLQRTHDIPYPEDHPNVTFYIHVDDVDAAYRKVTGSGWKTDHTPENQFWGGRIFTIHDINGFNLMFVQMVENPSLEEIRKRLS